MCTVEVAGSGTWTRLLQLFTPDPEPVLSSPAARAVAQIQHASELTIEAIAPLAGVSRRTLHSWLSGGRASQRNEERLRALAEAVEAIASVAPATARVRLMERVPGSPRLYDLLAEGRHEAAITRASGAAATPRPLIYPPPRPPSTPLAARVAALNDRSIPLDGPIDRRFTKRIKR
jgi:hypothetical protein